MTLFKHKEWREECVKHMYFLEYNLRSCNRFLNGNGYIRYRASSVYNVMLQSAYLCQQSESAIVAMSAASGQSLYRCTEWRIVKET